MDVCTSAAAGGEPSGAGGGAGGAGGGNGDGGMSSAQAGTARRLECDVGCGCGGGFSTGLVGRRVKHKGLDGVEFRCLHAGEDRMLVSECETTDTGESSGVVQVSSLCTQKIDLVGSTRSPSGKLCAKVKSLCASPLACVSKS